jgi:tellurium resistance protein TerZ
MDSYKFEKTDTTYNFEKAVVQGEEPITQLAFGAGWDPATSGKSIDLDISVVELDSKGDLVDVCYFNQLKSKDGAMSHSGDDLTGGNSADGDDEVINIDTTKLNANTALLALVITSFSDQAFKEVGRPYARIFKPERGSLLNREPEKEICKLQLGNEDTTGKIVGVLRKGQNGHWEMTSLDVSVKAKKFIDALPTIKSLLQA